MTQAASELGMSTNSVSRGCRAGNKAVKGFEFRLADVAKTEVWQGEEWRQMYDPISGFEVPGRMVSSLGRIRMCNGRISKGHLRKSGYYFFWISCVGRTELVHRLVAFSFLGQPVSKQRSHVNHKDMDKGNNAVENLEYVTPAQNLAHRYSNSSGYSRSDGRPVESRPHGSSGEWQWHPSMTSASKELKVFSANISRCISGRYKQTGGFEFRLAKDEACDIYEGEEWRKVDLGALLAERAARREIC